MILMNDEEEMFGIAIALTYLFTRPERRILFISARHINPCIAYWTLVIAMCLLSIPKKNKKKKTTDQPKQER